MPVWDAYIRIRQSYGLGTSKTNSDVQPWRQIHNRRPITANEPIEIELKFTISDLEQARSPVKLVVESGEGYKIRINGYSNPPPAGTWLDEAFTAYDVTNFLQPGLNTVVLATTFCELWELENSFLVGDFQVDAQAIGKPSEVKFAKTQLLPGDWTKQGYPFYAGQMKYEATFDVEGKEQIILEIGNLKAHIASVSLNGKDCGKVALPPYRLDLTDKAKVGENKLQIVVTNSLRNLLDPLHFLEKPPIAGPELFSNRRNWQDEYNLVPQGMDQVEVIFVE